VGPGPGAAPEVVAVEVAIGGGWACRWVGPLAAASMGRWGGSDAQAGWAGGVAPCGGHHTGGSGPWVGCCSWFTPETLGNLARPAGADEQL
jgi:hypothetical protein